MSLLGPCPECGEELGADQRYCANCGHAVETPLVPTYRPVAPREEMARSGGWPFPIPVSMAGTFAAAALAFGVLISTAIDPNLSSLVAGNRLTEEVQAGLDQGAGEPADGGKNKKGKKGGSGSSGLDTGSTTFDTGTGFYGSSGSFGYDFAGSTGGGSGGGSGNGTGGVSPPKKKPKPKPTYLTGTVVQQNPAALSYAISSGEGMNAIHVKEGTALPVPGEKVKVPVRQLANKTYAEDGQRQSQGTVTILRFIGTVSYSRDSAAPLDDVYTVSGRGASVPVRVADPAGTNTPPLVGEQVRVTARVVTTATAILPGPPPLIAPCTAPAPPYPDPAETPPRALFQETGTIPEILGTAKAVQIQGVMQVTCPAPDRVLVSADSVREANTDLSLALGTGLTLAPFTADQSVILSVGVVANTLDTVSASASDQGINGADDASKIQGGYYGALRKSQSRLARSAQKRVH